MERLSHLPSPDPILSRDVSLTPHVARRCDQPRLSLSNGAPPIDDAATYERNVENFIGTVRVPVGLAGPLAVNGGAAQGTYDVPLATTEACLVASYSRGAQLKRSRPRDGCART